MTKYLKNKSSETIVIDNSMYMDRPVCIDHEKSKIYFHKINLTITNDEKLSPMEKRVLSLKMHE